VIQTLDELLVSTPRTIVQRRTVDSHGLLPDGHTYDEPVLGEDAAVVFTSRLPLDRLVDAAESHLLPARLRVRVAAAAFVRATLFQRDEPARRAALILNQLAPALRTTSIDMSVRRLRKTGIGPPYSSWSERQGCVHRCWVVRTNSLTAPQNLPRHSIMCSI
jgi:hypothetical protein